MCSRIARSTIGWIVGSLVLAGAGRAGEPVTRPTTAPATLSVADGQFLEKMLAGGLLDPKGLRFVHFKLPVRDVWTNSQEQTVWGWAMEPKGDRGVPWALLDTGEQVPIVGPVEPADFVVRCQEMIQKATVRAERQARGTSRPAVEGAPSDENAPGTGLEMRNGSDRPVEAVPASYLAAWLHRLGHDAQAARMLYLARLEPHADEIPIPRPLTAWHWYSSAVHAYMVRADVEAWFYIRRMAEFFPESMRTPVAGAQAEEEHYPAAATLLAELERRRKAGTFAKAPAELPADLGTWPVERRVAFLIGQLDEVDARQFSQPGGIDFGGDKRIAALIATGDAAIPQLIDCIENDQRLTRSVHFWRDFSKNRTVVAVREPALVAVMSILKTRFFQPVATGDNFTSRGDAETRETARILREYWKTYGRLPFDQRMMTILTNPKAMPEAWREAAENLACLGGKRTIGTTVFTDHTSRQDEATPNPVIAKFKNPTVAEAILAAMDRDLAQHDRGERDELYDYHRIRIERQYIDALAELKDAAIIPALLKRLENPPSGRMRRLYCGACWELGEPKPLEAFAEDVRSGRLSVSNERMPERRDEDQPGAVELRGIVLTLGLASRSMPAADAALYAIADPKHPLFALAAAGVHRAEDYGEDAVWSAHPLALRILRRDLDDERPTGTVYSVERKDGQDWVMHISDGGTSRGGTGMPAELRDPSIRRESVESRVCDDAATRLSQLLVGVPYYHALLKDSDRVRDQLKAYLDVHLMHLRPATYAERRALRIDGSNTRFILAVEPLDRGSTAEDVTKGRAMFHFDGRGMPVAMKLPAVALLKRDEPPATKPTEADVAAGRAGRYRVLDDKSRPKDLSVTDWIVPRVLVVQAERGPNGKVCYGIISARSMEEVPEEAVAQISPLGE